MKFSERFGITAPKTVIQIDSMDDDLRVGLWNSIQSTIWDSHRPSDFSDSTIHSSLYPEIVILWRSFYKLPINDIPKTFKATVQEVRKRFFEAEWNEVYDLVEFVAQNLEGWGIQKFILDCNETFKNELSGYRFLEKELVPISAQEELDAVDEAMQLDANSGVRTHLASAVKMLSDRKNPDYRNSIKESISAVESLAKELASDRKATLGDAIQQIDPGSKMHPALVKGLKALYGYTSDADGIRHAMLEESQLSFDDAKFMLVICSAFVSYMVGKAAEKHI